MSGPSPKRRRLNEELSKNGAPANFYLVTQCPAFTHAVIFTDWDDCEKVVKKDGAFRNGVKFRKYATIDEAYAALLQSKSVDNSLLEASAQKTPVAQENHSSKKLTPDKQISQTGKMVHVWTDGACTSNGRRNAKAGWGVWFGPNDPRNACGSTFPPTNQRAELQAVHEALKRVPNESNVTIHSDSQYAMKCLTDWIPKWKRNGWQNARNEPVANQDLIRPIDDLLYDMGGRVQFSYVAGHSGDAGNNAADALARRGAAGC